MVRSKIDLAARHYGIETLHVSSPAAMRKALAARGADARMVLLDLDLDGVDMIALVGECRTAAPEARIVGFCSHVMTDLIQAARAAGAHSVMANSTFSAGVAGLFAPLAANAGA
jgi:DNA-binding NarL/FixJ family response regulator